MMKQEKPTFYQFINPVCLAIGIIGLLFYFEVGYLEMALNGLGLWGVTGLLHLNAQKKNKS